jgi:hypothetical protein
MGLRSHFDITNTNGVPSHYTPGKFFLPPVRYEAAAFTYIIEDLLKILAPKRAQMHQSGFEANRNPQDKIRRKKGR